MRTSKTLNFFKIFLVLLFWAMVFIFIQKVYNDESPYNDQDNEIRRTKKYTEFLKKFKVFSDLLKNNFSGYELLTDNEEIPDEDKLISAIELELPSIPMRFWSIYHNNTGRKYKCASFPSIFDLRYHNKYWQTAKIKNLTIHLYNAYYDTRNHLTFGPAVRVLGMTNLDVLKNITIYCHIWYEGLSFPITSRAESFNIWNNAYFLDIPQLIPKCFTCPIHSQPRLRHQIPRAVSLVRKPCVSAGNALRVHYDLPPTEEKQKFAICIKGMSFLEDFSARLVEWIELQLVLGVSKIYFHELSLHPNVSKVLQFYQKKGLVDIRPTTLAHGYPSSRFVQYYMNKNQRFKRNYNTQIVNNDCFYRNLYRYEYIAMQDIDEVLMPVANYTNWSQVMDIALRNHSKNCPNGYASYCFRHFHFSTWIAEYDESIPQFMPIMQRIQRDNRTRHVPRYNTKCFHSTDRTIMMHNHVAWRYFAVCQAYYFDADDVARLHHYRNVNIKQNTTVDLSARRYKDDVVKRSLDALKEMGFIKDLEKL